MPREAGIKVEPASSTTPIDYVLKCQNPDGGFSYMAGQGGFGGSGFARSAAGVLRPLLRRRFRRRRHRERPRLRQATPAAQRRRLPRGDGQHYFYGYYYATQAMFLAGGDYWANSTPPSATSSIRRQSPATTGPAKSPKTTATAMALIILQMPNRYLPVFDASTGQEGKCFRGTAALGCVRPQVEMRRPRAAVPREYAAPFTVDCPGFCPRCFLPWPNPPTPQVDPHHRRLQNRVGHPLGIDASGLKVSSAERRPLRSPRLISRRAAPPSPVANAAKFTLHLTGGDSLAGEPANLTAEALVWKNPTLGEISIPTAGLVGFARNAPNQNAFR